MTLLIPGRLRWTVLGPVLALLVLALSWGRDLNTVAAAAIVPVLAMAVLAAVHHAEVVALRVGEPFGSLVLAVAVTAIEVALIVTLMISGGESTSTLARDTVFAAVMISCNGIVGLSLLVGARKHGIVPFNAEGSGSALATVATLATLALVLPTFTTSEPGPRYSGPQLAFAALASLALYALFVSTQTFAHRDFFLPVRTDTNADGRIDADDELPDAHAEPPDDRQTLVSLVLLVGSLIAVVGLAKVESPSIERGVAVAGFPPSSVGVAIALLVLLPETLAAVRAAARNRMQTSLNLAYGSSLATIGLTIPTIAVVGTLLDIPLDLGLGPTQMVLLALTFVVSVLTVGPGRATRMEGGVHTLLLVAFLFLAVNP